MRVYRKLIVFFVPVPLLALISFGVFVNYQARLKLEQEVFSRLEAVSLLKRDKVQDFIDDKIGITKTIAALVNTSDFAFLSQHQIPDRHYSKAYDHIHHVLSEIQRAMKVSDLSLVDKQGNIVFYLSPQHQSRGVHKTVPSASLALAQKGVYIGEVAPLDEGAHPYVITLLSRINDPKGELAGYLSFEVNMSPVYKILEDNTGLGKTGESFLVGHGVGSDLSFLSPVRHAPNSILKTFAHMGSASALPAQYAADHQVGIGYSVDYRGKSVLASWRHIALPAWGLVVKLDQDEALSSIRELTYTIVLFVLATSFLLLIVTAKIAESIAKPIRKFHKSVEIVAAGDWSHRSALATRDEIGELSRVFDQMSAHLKETTASRDELTAEVHERKKAQHLLDINRRDLETLLYVTSHDLKEPLRAIEYFTNEVIDRYADKLDDKAGDFLQRSRDAAKRMTQLIDDILMLSRARKLVASDKDHHLKLLVQDALSRLTAKIGLTGATIKVADNLPQIPIDPFWATQAIYNLVSNALKFTREGVPPEIEIAPYEGEHGTGVRVLDRGCGVASEYLENIFGLFKRAVGREIEGTGAGLAIVKEVASRHGGKAWGEQREGGGSIFTITFGA